MPDLLIYYKTDWNPAVLHFAKLNSDGGETAWEDLVGQECDQVDQPGWQRFCISDLQTGIRFVVCNYTKTVWDHAPYSRYASGSKNYEICVPKGSTSKDPVYYTLYEGEITKLEGPPVCIITDLDGTLLGQDIALTNFNRYWEKSQLFKGSVLIYSTGRNLKDFLRAARAHNLLKPTLAICGVGTEIYAFKTINPTIIPANSHIDRLNVQEYLTQGYPISMFDASIQDDNFEGPDWCPARLHAVIDREWENTMTSTFNRLQAEVFLKTLFPKVLVDGSPYHDPFRLAMRVSRSDFSSPDSELTQHIQKLSKQLSSYNILLSGEGEIRHLDVLPVEGGKKGPIEYLIQKNHISPDSVLVCGDSGNDIDMFTLDGVKGCCVGNAQFDFKAQLMGQIVTGCDSKDEWSVAQHVFYHNKAVPATVQVHFSKYPNAAAILDSLQAFNFEKAHVIEPLIQGVSQFE